MSKSNTQQSSETLQSNQPVDVNSYNFILNTFNMLAKKGTFNLNESAIVYQNLLVLKESILQYNTLKQQIKQQLSQKQTA